MGMQLTTIYAKVRPKYAKIGGGRVLPVVTRYYHHDRQDKDVRARLAHVVDTGYFSYLFDKTKTV